MKLLIDVILRIKPMQEGEILIDGIQIKDYDIGYLRSQIGIVEEYPFLFKGTVR